MGLTLPISNVDVNVRTERRESETAGRPVVAMASFTVGGCVRVHGVELVRADGGRIEVVFPRHFRPRRCPGCNASNSVTNRHCKGCGAALPRIEVKRSAAGSPRLFKSLAHPVDRHCRAAISDAILHAYLEAVGVRPRLAVFAGEAS